LQVNPWQGKEEMGWEQAKAKKDLNKYSWEWKGNIFGSIGMNSHFGIQEF